MGSRSPQKVLKEALTAGTVLNRFFRFAILGLIPTAAYNVLTIVLVETGLMSPAFAMVVGFLSAVVISYQLNKRYTWKPEVSSSRHFHMFLIIAIFGAMTNYFIYVVVVQWLQLSYLFALLAVTIVIPVQNFVLNEKFNFKQPGKRKEVCVKGDNKQDFKQDI